MKLIKVSFKLKFFIEKLFNNEFYVRIELCRGKECSSVVNLVQKALYTRIDLGRLTHIRNMMMHTHPIVIYILNYQLVA